MSNWGSLLAVVFLVVLILQIISLLSLQILMRALGEYGRQWQSTGRAEEHTANPIHDGDIAPPYLPHPIQDSEPPDFSALPGQVVGMFGRAVREGRRLPPQATVAAVRGHGGAAAPSDLPYPLQQRRPTDLSGHQLRLTRAEAAAVRDNRGAAPSDLPYPIQESGPTDLIGHQLRLTRAEAAAFRDNRDAAPSYLPYPIQERGSTDLSGHQLHLPGQVTRSPAESPAAAAGLQEGPDNQERDRNDEGAWGESDIDRCNDGKDGKRDHGDVGDDDDDDDGQLSPRDTSGPDGFSLWVDAIKKHGVLFFCCCSLVPCKPILWNGRADKFGT